MIQKTPLERPLLSRSKATPQHLGDWDLNMQVGEGRANSQPLTLNPYSFLRIRLVSHQNTLQEFQATLAFSGFSSCGDYVVGIFP